MRQADMRRASRASISIEWAALFIVVAAALLSMSVYCWRAMCGRWREVGDSFGDGRQYEHCVTHIKETDSRGVVKMDGLPEECL